MNRKEIASFLKTIELFKELDAAEIKHLAEFFETQSLNEDEILYSQ